MEWIFTLIIIVLLFYIEIKLSNNNISCKKLHIIAIVILIAGFISSFYWSKLELQYNCNISSINYRPVGCDIKQLSYLGILNLLFPLLLFVYFWKIGNILRINKIKEQKQIEHKKVKNIFKFNDKNLFGKLLVIVSIILIIYRLILSFGMVDEKLFEDFIVHENDIMGITISLITPTLGFLITLFASILKKNK